MPAKLKRGTTRVEKPSTKTLQRGLKLGQQEWDRVLLQTVRSLGQATAEDVASAADLDIGRVKTSLQELVKARKIRKTAEDKYGITAAARSKNKR